MALFALVSVGLAVSMWGGARAAAAGTPVSSGLASPPAWAAGRNIHFYPSSAAASSSSGGLSARGLFGPPPPIKLGAGPVLYNEGGGGVEHSPHVYAVFWGSKWNEGTGKEAKAMLLKLYEGLSNSAYESILTQYFDATGRISSTVAVTPYVDTGVTAPTLVNDAKIQAEVAKAIETNAWTVEINNQFVVFTAPTSTYAEGFDTEKFCGYHGLTKEGVTGAVYTFDAYQGDVPFQECTESGKTEKNYISDTSAVASHEFAESATNPDLNTWHTPHEEIADICRGEKIVELPDGAWGQNWFDDHLNNCFHEDLGPPHVYAISKEATEIKTNEAKLNGVVNAEGLETKYYFDYGTTISYGSKTTEVSAGSGVTNQNVSPVIKGLTTKTEYHFRVVAKNSTGSTPGKDKTFKTL